VGLSSRVHFSVITHDRSKSLEVLLASVADQDAGVTPEITILDNGSSRYHADAVQGLANRHGARLLRNERNRFLAAKRDIEDEIFARTRPDVLVRVDDDVVLSRGWLSAVLTVLEGGAAACGSVEDHGGDLAISGQRRFGIVTEVVGRHTIRVWDWRWHEPDLGVTSEPVELAGQRALALNAGVAFGIRHDPVFRIGGEDADYSLRLREAGHELRVATDALIRHRVLGEADIAGARVATNVISSWSYFYRRWGFVKRSGAVEAGLAFEEFVDAILGGQ
jgi:GT2 family glycosyltransferase